MKFTCDSCGAAYMISDDKVGPSGVKVRCKKCGNVITVKRAEPAPVVAPAPAAPPAAGGFDDELGNAFDHAFGSGAGGGDGGGAGRELEAPRSTPVPEAPDAPAPESAPAPAASTPAPAAAEWYVAIGEAQVGPLPLSEVKKKWEAADIGPDSLVWRPGMGDWGPLSAVAELAAYLSPVARSPQPVAAPAAAVTAMAPEPSRARSTAPASAPAAMTPSPGAEIAWKPSGASALAALASEELVSRQAPAAAASPAAASGRSIMEQLPDSGGVDPTGAIPLPIKGLDQTDERPVRRSSVARGAEETRQRRSRRTMGLAAAGLLVVAGGGAAAWYTLGRTPAPAPAPQVAAQAPTPVAPAPQPPPAPAAAPAPAEPAAAAAVAGGAAVTVAAAAKAEPAKADAVPPPTPAPAAEPPKAEEPAKVAAAVKKAPAKLPTSPRPAPPAGARSAAVAAAEPAAERPAAQAAPAKKKDSVLDFDQGGSEDLDAALGNAGGRSVYVPPKPGGTAAPERLTDGQITESVKLHVDALRRCAAEQGSREPGTHGTLKMAWTIGADGTPRDVRCLTPDLAQGAFAQCITGVVKGVRFPRLSDARGQAVTFPFGF